MRLVTWIVFIPPLWACASAKGPILWRFTHSSRSCSCKRSTNTITVLPRGCFTVCTRLKGRRWRQEKSGHHGETPEGLVWVPGGSGRQQADLSTEQLSPESWEPQTTQNPMSFPIAGFWTCATSSSKWVWWYTSVSVHLHFKEVSLA